MKTKVDFSFAFAEPHRMCICLPEASRKCLLDASKTGLTIAWTDEDLTKRPLGALAPLWACWWLDLTAEAGGSALPGKMWERVDNRIPALEYRWENERISVDITAVAVKDADVFAVYASNRSSAPTTVRVLGTMRNHVSNQMWIDPDSNINTLLPTVGDTSDRMLFLVAGAPKPSKLPKRESLVIEWEIKPGEKKKAFLIKPHFAILDDAEKWLARNWEEEIIKGLDAWRNLLKNAPEFSLPDPMVADAYYAGISDIFVMREKQSDGSIAHCPGTECYRSAGSGEASLAAIALDQAGFHKQSEDGMRLPLSFQEKNGRWDDFRRWGHDMWGLVGFKCLAIREHYFFTHNRKYLAECFKRMTAHIKWSEAQRKKTKVHYSNEKPLTWGLMPRGMGDCGLLDDSDLYGIFLPHNIWHYFVIKTALWTANELGKKKEAVEIEKYLKDFHSCLLDSLERGVIKEPDGTRWIPGVPGKTCGSRWGAANAIYPCEVIEPYHPLATGTLAFLEKNMSEGGIPLNLGWLPNGLWVSIALDNLSYAHLVRGEEDKAVSYLYPTINHGTPLFSWCEERSPEPGATQIGGDRQHAWTPISVPRFIRDMLVMEDGNILHICRAVPRWWLEPEQEIKVKKAPTHWGVIDYSLKRPDKNKLIFEMQLTGKRAPKQIILHCRIPETDKTFVIRESKGAETSVSGDKITLTPQSNFISVTIKLSD